MSSRDGFNGNQGYSRDSPEGGTILAPTERAAAAYEEVFFRSADSNEARLRLLEERMTRPGAGTVGDASRGGAERAEIASDSDDDHAEQAWPWPYSYTCSFPS